MTSYMLGIALSFFLFQAPPPQVYVTRCSGCHGDNARGTAKGPGLAMNPRLAERSTADLRAYIEHGNPGAGMPSFASLPPDQLNAVAGFVRHINNDMIAPPPPAKPAARRTDWKAPGPGDWATYNGSYSSNRFSPLKQITAANVSSLKLKWVFPIAYFGLEVTPLVIDGVMYVTGPNQVFALDAATGNPIWHYSRPQSPSAISDAALGTNRGVAVRNDKVYFVTDNAHLLALDRATGSLLWEISIPPPMPGEQHYYGGTMAPLIVEDKLFVGVSGADEGIRGFVAAFNAEDGKLIWRTWTVPRKGERGIETWNAKEPITGGGSSWLTGSYDRESDTLYWATGNPWPDMDDRERPGDNLFTDCVLALDPKTGGIKWHYQFTPHDVKDRDATEPNVLVDTQYRGKPSKLLLHADRNGFFYVLDRTKGNVLLAKPFLRRVDWASSIGPDGRPVVKDPHGCPSDAANWDSTAFSPETRLYYVLTLEECTGEPTGYPNQTGRHYLRAINIDTGDIAWEIPQPGKPRAKTWTGVVATAGGVLFYGVPNGGFEAVDPRTGKQLWHFPTNVRMKASPMTFEIGGKQYVAVAAGPNILCFGL